jgi:hypothetical protein
VVILKSVPEMTGDLYLTFLELEDLKSGNFGIRNLAYMILSRTGKGWLLTALFFVRRRGDQRLRGEP